MNKPLTYAILSAALICTLYACKAKKSTSAADSKPVPQKAQTVCSGSVTYTANVKAILDKHCASSCHGKGGAGGIDLTTYDNVSYEAGKAKFLGSLKHEELYQPMPKKNPKLSDSTIQIIECWIEGGKLQ